MYAVYLCYWGGNSRGTSTKTRIETDCLFEYIQRPEIQEAHPLKQGLKLGGEKMNSPNCQYSRGTSTKTRIETMSERYNTPEKLEIQEAHPLKQGLKHSLFVRNNDANTIQEAHPLKQGLKPQITDTTIEGTYDSRGTSTKTRIETRYYRAYRAYPSKFKRHIH